MKEQIKRELIKYTLMKLKEYGWALECALPKGDFDDEYEIEFEKSDRSNVSFVIFDGITLRFANMKAVERDYGDLAFVQLSPDELILFHDICYAVKDLSDEDAYNAIMEGVRSL